MSNIRSAPRKLWSFLNIINRIVPKNEKKIFIYSNLGFRDNIRALYDFLIANKYNEKYKIICSLNDFQKQLPCKNVKFMGNLRGLFSFFTCKYAFYCFGKYPVKPRSGQAVFNLWHGMPLKCVGNMIKGCENTDYNYFTHILCTSEFFRDTIKKSFKCTDQQIVICGEPRTDEMLKASAHNEKMLLWTPTFRDDGSELDILSPVQFEQLNALCQKYDWKIVIKLHPLSDVKPENYGQYKNIQILSHQQLEEKGGSFYKLLGRSGGLITDYSSVYFDYLLLDRPIGFAVEDMDNYGNDRGFNFENPVEYMPGEHFTNGEELIEFVGSVFMGQDKYKDKRKKLNDIFNSFQDAENCKRAVEAVGIRK